MATVEWKTPVGHKISPNEANNIVYLTCKYTVQWPMRSVDLAVVQTLINKDLTGPEAMEDLMSVTCEYVWDHLAGEPDEFKPEDLKTHMASMLNEFWEMSPEQRNEI